MVQLIPREGFDLARTRAEEQRLGDDYEYNLMHGTPYVMRRRMLLAPSKLPCTPPPFGTLVAIDLKTGGRRWDVPLGSIAGADQRRVAATVPAGLGLAEPRRPDRHGRRRRLHRRRARSVAPRVRHRDRPRAVARRAAESGKATPMSYRLASGDQFVAIAVGGGGAWGAGDYVVAFKLPG